MGYNLQHEIDGWRSWILDFWAKLAHFLNLTLKVGSFPNYCSKWPFEATSAHKSIFYIVFTLPFPSPCSILSRSVVLSSVWFFFLNLSPTSGPLKKTVELQSIKFKVSHNILFGLYKVFGTFQFFFPSQNLGF